jgi:hypothetical protein
MSRALPSWGSRGQGVKLFGRRVALFDPAFQLVFPQHVHKLNPSQGLLGGAERREPQLGMGDSLHAAMMRSTEARLWSVTPSSDECLFARQHEVYVNLLSRTP